MRLKLPPLPYLLAGVCAVSAAFLIAVQFTGRARAQAGDAPPPPPPPAGQEAPQRPNPAAGAPQAGAPQTVATPSKGAPPPSQAGDPPSGQPGGAAGAPPVLGQTGVPAGAQNNPNVNSNAQFTELEGFLEPFIYDAVNRRDPFLPYAEYVPQGPSSPSRPLSPAQRWDLDQLRLVGIMWDVKDPKAMFMDPDAEVLVLGRDEGVGNRNGYIAAIREGEVVVIEAIRKRGDVVYKTRVLRIER